MLLVLSANLEGPHARDRMVVGFTTSYANSAPITTNVYGFESCLWRDVLDTTLCDEVGQ